MPLTAALLPPPGILVLFSFAKQCFQISLSISSMHGWLENVLPNCIICGFPVLFSPRCGEAGISVFPLLWLAL